ncbi:hypothetical protein [Methanoregula sp.]|uniref:hypothetical protein n=1 Tax=Methanoregula sp. TaxID=2052170 RepID=UPI0035630ECE
MNGSPAPDENEPLLFPEHWTEGRVVMDGSIVIGSADDGETLIMPPEPDGMCSEDTHPVASRILKRIIKRENIFLDNVMGTPERFQ